MPLIDPTITNISSIDPMRFMIVSPPFLLGSHSGNQWDARGVPREARGVPWEKTVFAVFNANPFSMIHFVEIDLPTGLASCPQAGAMVFQSRKLETVL
jgi:hypothetical protein